MDNPTSSWRKQVKYFQESADDDWQAAQSLFELGHYNLSLFTCHLAIEKYLKAIVMIETETKKS